MPLDSVAALTPEPAEPVLARAAAGDPEAVKACIDRYGGLVWALARRFEPGDAEDAVQEIFVEVWRHAVRFDPALGSEATFIAMIARRRLIDRRRTRQRRPVLAALPDADQVPAPTQTAETSSDATRAARALDQLRPEQREVLVLATCHGLSHGDIAERTGMPLGTVKAHARRGLLAIRNALLGVDRKGTP